MLNTCLSKTGQFCPPGTVLPRCLFGSCLATKIWHVMRTQPRNVCCAPDSIHDLLVKHDGIYVVKAIALGNNVLSLVLAIVLCRIQLWIGGSHANITSGINYPLSQSWRLLSPWSYIETRSVDQTNWSRVLLLSFSECMARNSHGMYLCYLVMRNHATNLTRACAVEHWTTLGWGTEINSWNSEKFTNSVKIIDRTCRKPEVCPRILRSRRLLDTFQRNKTLLKGLLVCSKISWNRTLRRNRRRDWGTWICRRIVTPATWWFARGFQFLHGSFIDSISLLNTEGRCSSSDGAFDFQQCRY